MDFQIVLPSMPTSCVVDAFYDRIEERIAASGTKWYFLVNYRNCQIHPDAWLRYATRGKAVNLRSSLGSVRFDASPETAFEIARRADTEAFGPNLFPSREQEVQRLSQMRDSAH